MQLRFDLRLREFCIVQFGVITAVVVSAFFAIAFTKLTGHGSLFGFLRLLNVSDEQSIPTYVSVINLLLASILLFIIYSYEIQKKHPRNGYWLFLSILFLYLSIDESASIHEKFGNIHAYLVQNDWIPQLLHDYSWVLFGVLFVVAVFIVLLPFLRQLPSLTRRYFVIAGCVFVIGAIGFEFLGGWMLESGIVESTNDTIHLVRRIFEEGFEMYGVVIFNCALYREILERRITVTFGGQ